jgi:cbb3-type cytochrome oxidase subunit 1
MNIGIRLIRIAAMYLLIGVGIGLAMGISRNFSLMSVHSHISLLGWATMAIAGIVYILVPGCDRSRLAALHFWGHNIGLPVMIVSLALETYGYKGAEKAIGAGSMLTLLSLLIFAINVYLNGRAERPA